MKKIQNSVNRIKQQESLKAISYSDGRVYQLGKMIDCMIVECHNISLQICSLKNYQYFRAVLIYCILRKLYDFLYVTLMIIN